MAFGTKAKSTVGMGRPQSMSLTGAPPPPDMNGQVSIDTTEHVMTPEEEAAAREAQRQNDIRVAEYERANGKIGDKRAGTLDIDDGPSDWELILGKKSARQMSNDASQEYRERKYGYDPYNQDLAGTYGSQDFNPYRQAANAEADRAAQEQRQGAYNQLVSDGPVSASDRMSLASNFNRQKITGSFAGNSQANQRENQSEMQTAEQNIGRRADVNQADSMAQNMMLRGKAGAEENRRLNLYRSQKEDELMDRRLKAAAAASKTDVGRNTLMDVITRALGKI